MPSSWFNSVPLTLVDEETAVALHLTKDGLGRLNVSLSGVVDGERQEWGEIVLSEIQIARLVAASSEYLADHLREQHLRPPSLPATPRGPRRPRLRLVK